MRDIPDRSAPRAAAPPPGRPIEGADFLLEPGSTAMRPRAPDVDAGPPKTAINAHIAAARRAAQQATAGTPGRDRRPAPAVDSGAASDRTPDALAVQAKAFLAARRRPLLLAATLLAAIATLAIIELRGARPALTQKSEIEAPAKITRKSMPPVVGANSAVGIDTSPVGSIAPAPSQPKSAARPAPAELVAAMPAALPQGLRDAAAAGNLGAQFELGLRLIEGRGVAQDPHGAAQWFELAAAHDLPIAQYRLGALYEKGVGVTRDPQLAISWYTKAATAGNARAMHNLAVMNAEAAVGGKPDYAEAAHWFRKAGELGVRDSQFNLGILCARGLGVPQDLTQAWVWFSLAAQQGDADAGKKRDEVAAKMDAKALVAAAKALAAFQLATPAPAANEAPAPAGGWDAKGAAQASPAPGARAGSTTL
jgi:localization factor PodJL